MSKTFKAPGILNPTSGFCAGCGHGIINRILAENLEEMEVEKNNHRISSRLLLYYEYLFSGR